MNLVPKISKIVPKNPFVKKIQKSAGKIQNNAREFALAPKRFDIVLKNFEFYGEILLKNVTRNFKISAEIFKT